MTEWTVEMTEGGKTVLKIICEDPKITATALRAAADKLDPLPELLRLHPAGPEQHPEGQPRDRWKTIFPVRTDDTGLPLAPAPYLHTCTEKMGKMIIGSTDTARCDCPGVVERARDTARSAVDSRLASDTPPPAELTPPAVVSPAGRPPLGNLRKPPRPPGPPPVA